MWLPDPMGIIIYPPPLSRFLFWDIWLLSCCRQLEKRKIIRKGRGGNRLILSILTMGGRFPIIILVDLEHGEVRTLRGRQQKNGMIIAVFPFPFSFFSLVLSFETFQTAQTVSGLLISIVFVRDEEVGGVWSSMDISQHPSAIWWWQGQMKPETRWQLVHFGTRWLFFTEPLLIGRNVKRPVSQQTCLFSRCIPHSSPACVHTTVRYMRVVWSWSSSPPSFSTLPPCVSRFPNLALESSPIGEPGCRSPSLSPRIGSRYQVAILLIS